jgi:hypothetical protein
LAHWGIGRGFLIVLNGIGAMAGGLYAIPSSLGVQYPTSRESMQQLREILSRMKLEFLCEIAWDIKDPTYLDFFNTRVDPRLAGSVR